MPRLEVPIAFAAPLAGAACSAAPTPVARTATPSAVDAAQAPSTPSPPPTAAPTPEPPSPTQAATPAAPPTAAPPTAAPPTAAPGPPAPSISLATGPGSQTFSLPASLRGHGYALLVYPVGASQGTPTLCAGV